MALMQIHYLSQVMSRIVTFHMFMPNDVQEEFKTGNPHYNRPTKTLYLLHGYSGNTTDWVTGSDTMDLSRKYNLAIVMPSGENSFYIDRKATGQAYETYVAEELREYVCNTFGLSEKPQDTFIGGLSMGGYGALRLGLKYNDRYGAAMGLSSALILDELSQLTPQSKDVFSLTLANYEYYQDIFGELSKVLESDINPKYIIRKKLEQKEGITPLFLACGTEDPLLETNRQFVKFAEEQRVDIVYREGPGIHDWHFWNQSLEPAIQWALQKLD